MRTTDSTHLSNFCGSLELRSQNLMTTKQKTETKNDSKLIKKRLSYGLCRKRLSFWSSGRRKVSIRSRVTYLKLALASSSLDCYTLHDVVQQQRALLLLVVVGEHVEHHGTRRPGLESVQWGTTATLQLQQFITITIFQNLTPKSSKSSLESETKSVKFSIRQVNLNL